MNSILVTCDALRADHLSQYGYHRETMPALDRLLESGVGYQRAVANGAHTRLSIPSFLTSRLNGLRAASRGETVAAELQSAGVTTAGFHSNAVMSADFPEMPGFDHWADLTGSAAETDDQDDSRLQELTGIAIERLRPYLGQYDWAVRLRQALIPDTIVHVETPYVEAEQVTDRVLAWLDDRGEGELCCWIHYMDPHRPYAASIDESPFIDSLPTDSELEELMAKAGVSPEQVTDRERELLVDLYDADLRYLSGQLDRLFDELQERGLWEESIILFSADHGEEFGEHGLFYHRNKPYDELIRVPLVEKPAGETAGGAWVDEQRELLDIGPTLLAAHGLESPSQFEGRPLGDGAARTAVSAAFRDDRLMLGVSDGEYKYITTDDGETELYDLQADPGERESTLEGEPDVARRLSGVLTDEMVRLRDSIERFEELGEADEQARDRLDALGYLE